jgi:hypothetical protein
LSPRLCRSAARVVRINGAGALNMTACYLSNDSDIDVERCRISMREKSPITLFVSDRTGRVLCLTGVVQSIQFDPARVVGTRWRVEMELLTVGSGGVR